MIWNVPIRVRMEAAKTTPPTAQPDTSCPPPDRESYWVLVIEALLSGVDDRPAERVSSHHPGRVISAHPGVRDGYAANERGRDPHPPACDACAARTLRG